MNKLIAAAVAFALLIIGISVTALLRSNDTDDRTGELAVGLNEIEKLIERGETDEAARCASELRVFVRQQEYAEPDRTVPIMCGVCVLFIIAVTGYVCIVVIRPFRRLTDFAERVALGDLETPLEYERTNLFGKFTWAFDSMRQEISKARACEKEAIENNKTVIASLSHDIKTPISSIRAYAEALELGMDGAPEKRQRYIETIVRKCDEVSKLTEDMLTHSLSELDKLKMSPETFELTEELSEILDDISAGGDDIRYDKPSYKLDIYADKARLAQLVENLVNNARKYAKTGMDISVTRDERTVYMHFRDYGKGIPDDELPFVLGKFYRGKNSGGEKGAGLGLFIVKYIAEQSGGSVSLRNCGSGLEVTVGLPVAAEK